MKNQIKIIIILLITFGPLVAQVPQQINYQAVVRNNSGQTVAAGTNLKLRFTIHDNSAAGTPVYTETTNTLTANQFGLVNTVIGSNANLSAVNWGVNSKWLQVEADINVTGTFTDMGTTQLNAVPYALYAANSPMGATGPTGPQGMAGSTGPTGPTGPGGINGTTNYIPKYTATTTIGNSQLYDDGVSVSMGTVSPSHAAKMVISGAGTFTLSEPYKLAGIACVGATTQGSSSGLYAEGGWRGVYGRNPGLSGGAEAVGVYGQSEGSAYSKGMGVRGDATGTGTSNYGAYFTAANGGVNFGLYAQATGNGAAARLTAQSGAYGMTVMGGNVGIGTVTPDALLQVEAPIYSGGTRLVTIEDTVNTGSSLVNLYIHTLHPSTNPTGIIVNQESAGEAIYISKNVSTSTNPALSINSNMTSSTPALYILSNNGYAANLIGKVRISDGTQRSGAVLVSDAVGMAHWDTTLANPRVGFSASVQTASLAGGGTDLIFTNEQFDDGANYDNSSGIFKAPTAGVYHFDAHEDLTSSSTSNSYLQYKVNGTVLTYTRSSMTIPSGTNVTISISADLKLQAGDNVQVGYGTNSSTVTQLSLNYCTFSGHKIY